MLTVRYIFKFSFFHFCDYLPKYVIHLYNFGKFCTDHDCNTILNQEK